jgi:polar amino acid transport system ATP-binding protein
MAHGMTPNPTVSVRAVTLERGGRRFAVDVSFDVGAGELLALCGASGSGKTTLLRAIAGLETLVSGAIDVCGCRLVPGPIPAGAGQRALYRHVGVVFQFHNLFAHLTALQNVCLAPRHVLGAPTHAIESNAKAMLATLGVENRADAFPHELSGGEAQRVAIARGLGGRPPVVLMDEPTASLDAARRVDLARVLRGLAEAGHSVIVTSHDLEFLRMAAGRTLYLREGRLYVPPGVS